MKRIKKIPLSSQQTQKTHLTKINILSSQKALNKLGIESNFIQGIRKKPNANIILEGERMNVSL